MMFYRPELAKDVKEGTVPLISKLDLYSKNLNIHQNFKKCNLLPAERLHMLKLVDFVNNLGTCKRYTEAWLSAIEHEILKQKLYLYSSLFGSIEDIKSADVQSILLDDYFAHKILYLFCLQAKTDHIRDWFVKHEKDLFIVKCMKAEDKFITSFANTLGYEKIEDKEFEVKLNSATFLGNDPQQENFKPQSNFYRVHFTDAVELVKDRLVYLEKGYAYVPLLHLWTCFATKFQQTLEARMLKERNCFVKRKGHLHLDFRIKMVFEDLQDQFGEQGSYSQIGIGLEDIDNIAQDNFPLCMSHIHKVLRKDHKLKHGCRVQYTPFLKDIGVNVEDCLELFRLEFIKDNPEKKFKEYAYYIRHFYGLLGHRVAKKALSCERILQENPVGSMQQHGCPYKEWSPDVLRKELILRKVPNVEEVVETAQAGRYQAACATCFQGCHKGRPRGDNESAPKSTIQHPNEYFTDSYEWDMISDNSLMEW